MLPIKTHQLSYQDFSNLVWRDFKKLEEFQSKLNLKFDIVISKLRNGVIPGSIVANQLALPLITIEAPRNIPASDYEVLAPKKVLEKLKKGCNILFVDGICGTGETLKNVKDFLTDKFPKSKNFSYCTLVDKKAIHQPDVIGFLGDDFLQPPWEWRSFTPQTHLERLEQGNIKASSELNYYIGFGSHKCKQSFDLAANSIINPNWINIFNLDLYQNKIMSTSGISTLEFPSSFALDDLHGKFNSLIKEKAEFIKTFGFTHFIEDDFFVALMLSEKCPVTNIIYLDKTKLYKIYGHQIPANDIINLSF